MSEPTVEFDEPPSPEVAPLRPMTVGSLITKLTTFADFYEQATALIDSADVFDAPHALGSRGVSAEQIRQTFRATCDIDRVRGYVLGSYGDELTIGTARRVLGDLIRRHRLTPTAAETLTLGAAMDLLEDGPTNSAVSPLQRDATPTGGTNTEARQERLAPAAALTRLDGGYPMPSGLTQFASLASIFRAGVELAEAAVAVDPSAFDGLTGTSDDPPSEMSRTVELVRALVVVQEESYRMKRAMGAEVPYQDELLPDSVECEWDHFTQKFVGTDYGRTVRQALTKLGTAAIDLSGFAILRGPNWPMRASGLDLLRWWMAQLWEGMPTIERNCVKELLPRLHTSIGWPTGQTSEPAPYEGPKDIPIENSYRCYTNFVSVGPVEITGSCNMTGDHAPPVLSLIAPPPPLASPAVVPDLANMPTVTGKRQNSDAGRPGRDRQQDILAAINAAKTPLTRPELVKHMRLGSEGKLGANLAWMVTNNILINLPQRGYWPCGVEVPA